MTRSLFLAAALVGCQGGGAEWREVRLGEVVAIVNEPTRNDGLARFDTVAYAGRLERTRNCLRFIVDGRAFTPVFTTEALARRAASLAGSSATGIQIVGGGSVEGKMRQAVRAAGGQCPEPYFLISELQG
jgi:hypothetical protein